MQKTKIKLNDVKQALLDERFRESLPESFQDDIKSFMKNPGCSCNHPFYKKIILEAPEFLAKYYPNKLKINPEEIEKEISQTPTNEWLVINCSVDELSSKLKKLPPGRMQLEMARYQDQVTVVIHRFDSPS